MTREEAIKILDPQTTGEALTEIEYYNGFSGKAAALQAVLDASVLAVAALRDQEERRWIPVTERLPKEWVDVLVLSRYGFCEVAVYLGIPGKWRVTWNHDLFEVDSITHWMPLPEPPKEV